MQKTWSSTSRSSLVEVLAADAGDGQRVDLAEEDAAGVELVAAQLGHQAAAGAADRAASGPAPPCCR